MWRNRSLWASCSCRSCNCVRSRFCNSTKYIFYLFFFLISFPSIIQVENVTRYFKYLKYITVILQYDNELKIKSKIKLLSQCLHLVQQTIVYYLSWEKHKPCEDRRVLWVTADIADTNQFAMYRWLFSMRFVKVTDRQDKDRKQIVTAVGTGDKQSSSSPLI